MAEGVCFDPPDIPTTPLSDLFMFGRKAKTVSSTPVVVANVVTQVKCPRRVGKGKSSCAENNSGNSMGSEDGESVSSEEDNCRKKRCSDRYDSSESSDSGVAVHCGDSSNSDITEPCSPLSTTSLEEMPPTQTNPSWPWVDHQETPPSKRAKQGKITEYFKSKMNKFLGGVKAVELSVFQEWFQTDKDVATVGDSTEDCLPSPSFLETPPASTETPDPTNSSTDWASVISKEDAEEHSCSSSGVSSLFRKQSSKDVDDSTSSTTPSINSSSTERTIRFPVKNGWRGHYVSDVICRWDGCEAKFGTSCSLLEHLQAVHVNGQTLAEYFVCRWTDCKVFDRKSCSRTWLERHVLSHGGNKPYRCIVDGCGHRFSSQTLLQRHVNNHFSEKEQKTESKKGCEVNNRLIRRNGKKLRFRRQPFSARIYDYFDAGIMEGLQYNLIKVTEKRTLGLFDSVPPDVCVLQSEIVGKRTDFEGQTEVLVRWYPNNILDDEWVDPAKVLSTRQVRIASLTVKGKEALSDYLYGHQRLRQIPRSRKPGGGSASVGRHSTQSNVSPTT